MSQTQDAPTGRPGRYQRSFGGLVGAMIVMVIVVVGLWLGLGAFRDDAAFEPTPIDYDQTVAALVDSGVPLTYPEELPEGWRVNNLGYDPGTQELTLALLTPEESFAGLYVGYDELDDVLDTFVDEQRGELDPVRLTDADGATAEWATYSDEGGDTAYAREVGGGREPQVVVVYGSADPEDLQRLVGLLTTADGAGR